MTPEPKWVDLGLPSGVLWRDRNLGAPEPQSPGLFYSWGNIEGHPRGAGYDFSAEVYAATPGGSVNTDLSGDNDAATIELGPGCRMPTGDEMTELNVNCTRQLVTIEGQQCIKFTSNINGNSILLPMAGLLTGTTISVSNGHYWGSTMYSSSQASAFNFGPSWSGPNSHENKYQGLTIRPVKSSV